MQGKSSKRRRQNLPPDPTVPETQGGPVDGRRPLAAVPGRSGLPPVRITDVTSHPLGVIVVDKSNEERVVSLVPEATPVPCERRGRFAYAYDNMTAVRIEVTEGRGRHRDEVKVIGEVVVDNLPPRPRGTPIEVIYRYGINQILEIDIVDVQTQRVRRARMDLKGTMDSERLKSAQEAVARFQVH